MTEKEWTIYDPECTIYMAGGNFFACNIEKIEDNIFHVYNHNWADNGGVGGYKSDHYEIDMEHIVKIEFHKPRAKTGFEFIGLEY